MGRGSSDGSEGVSGHSAGPAARELSSRLGSITNERGQTLFDIRDQLLAAVREAIAEHDAAGGDRSGVIRDAIDATLVRNGFDPAQLEAERGAINPLQGNPLRAGLTPGLYGAPGTQSLEEALFGDDDDGGGAADFLQALLGQFRAGINLDLEI